MTVRPLVLVATAFAILLGAGAAVAQTPQPPQVPSGRSAQPTRPAPPPAQPAQAEQPPTPPPPRVEGPLQNVRVELTITDQRGGAAPVKKAVTIIAADGVPNRVRSSSQFAGLPGEIPLNVDVTPFVRSAGNKIRLNLTLEYVLPASQLVNAETAKGPVLTRTTISENLNTVLDDGKAMVIAQSADPVSDRQVTLEVKATLMR